MIMKKNQNRHEKGKYKRTQISISLGSRVRTSRSRKGKGGNQVVFSTDLHNKKGRSYIKLKSINKTTLKNFCFDDSLHICCTDFLKMNIQCKNALCFLRPSSFMTKELDLPSSVVIKHQ